MKVKQSKAESDDRTAHIRKQKELIETENDRLRRQLEGGRPKEAVTIEQATRASEKIISQLNLQLEISQESQREAEDHSGQGSADGPSRDGFGLKGLVAVSRSLVKPVSCSKSKN